MTRILKWLSRTPNYVKSFGMWHGLRLLLLVDRSVSRKSGAIAKYNVPGYSGPIHLRETISDHSIFWQCIVQRQYDIHSFPQSDRLMAAYRKSVDEGLKPLIVDCGGNIGLSALYLATLFPKASVYAIEPDEENFRMLLKNTAALGSRVVALRGGIWHESGNLRITNPESGSAAFRVAPSPDSSDGAFRAYTIDEVCALAGVDAPLIVKIDIEGAQASLFKSKTNWVENTHLIMLELDDWLMPWQGTSRPFFTCISKYPFDYLISGETIFCFRDFHPAV